MDMEFARQHWKILQEMEKNFTDQVREFMVINKGKGVLMVTKPGGKLFWYGKMQFGTMTKETTEPTRLDACDLVKMAQGENHIVLLDEMGTIYTFGLNNQGQLGKKIACNLSFTPMPFVRLNRYVDVRCGLGYSLALNEDGMVFGWGSNNFGQTSVDCDELIIQCQYENLDPNSDRVVAIECGGWHSLVLTNQGRVFGLGYNHYGQLAKSNRSTIITSVQLQTGYPTTQIAAGFCHTLLLTKEGLVFACGNNDCGQLGQPTSIRESFHLLQVSGLPRIAQIASHFDTNLSIALSTDRRCYVWGIWNNSKCPIPLQLPSIYSTIESPFSCTESGCQETPHSIRLKVPPLNLTTDSLVDSLLTSNNDLLRQLGQMHDNPNFESYLHYTLEELNSLRISDDNRSQFRESTRRQVPHSTTFQHNPSNSQISIIHNHSNPSAIVYSLLRNIYNTTQN